MLGLLFELQDIEYGDFHSKLMPNIKRDKVIGIRVGNLRKLCKKVKNTEKANNFLKELPHNYYEENALHCLLICEIKDFDACLKAVEDFLPYIDNWATCDMLRPKALGDNSEKLYDKIMLWLADDKEYTVRFGIEMLMLFFLGDNFKDEILNYVSSIRREEYYINMMIAWFFAEALVKQPSKAIKYLEENLLSKWCHNKAIQKAVESYRIPNEMKSYLKTLRIK